MPDNQEGAVGTAPAERPYWIAFSHVPGIGPARFGALRTRFGGARRAWSANERALGEVLDRRSLDALVTVRRRLEPDEAMAAVGRRGAWAITVEDPEYPPQLRTIDGPPFVLYGQGDLARLSAPAVAVVGTRDASKYGRDAAALLAGGLAAAGVTVVSGLARGIDAAAHQAALEHGRTVAVLGTGLDQAYPAANGWLQARIATHGALVTEYPLGSSPEPGNFPARNRIVSGLALATVVVEAGVKSGALITARLALEQGRDVLAVPGSIFHGAAAGTNALLASGAGVARSADDILAALDLATVAVRPSRQPVVADPTQAALLAAMTGEGTHIDVLARTTGLPVTEVARALQLLELGGLVRHVGGMTWVIGP